MSFTNVLTRYRAFSFSERDKGDRFERLMQAYLRTDPKYAYRFKQVWLWSEFPARGDFGDKETGIDLVALTHEGEYWAIQCKCRQESAVIDKPAVDSFLATSSREFMDEHFQTTRFAHRLWISTTNKWGPNATEAIKNQNPPVTRINLFDLIEAPVDWEKLEQGIHGESSRLPRKTLFPHQREALEKAHAYFQNAERDRGKLIMACGTGKTLNALRIAEHETQGQGIILFLVPSIALLGQTLREWSADALEPLNAICICSDPKVSKKRGWNDDVDAFSVVDLAWPASTDPDYILRQFKQIKAQARPGMTVVFSTYQSIDVIAEAQARLLKSGFPEFDLIICDEAHRTTGVTLADEDESAFTKVHDNAFLRAKKRLYMTATPRLYSDDAKSKAAQADAVLCSMDDPALYGEEIYRIGFGEAVERDLLSDYKVLILTLSDRDVPPAVQRMVAEGETEIDADDVSRLIGCVNALSKQFIGDEGVTLAADPEPMRRAVAFCSNIAASKKITATFNTATAAYLDDLPLEKKARMVSIAANHMDGTMGAPQRDELMTWLKAPTENNVCRILTNVRVLSEGVDVPSLDAVLFLSARNSQVDVVQSVGRVMRKAPGKKYGYIIIPVIVPADVEPDRALDDNERYRVVWTVLNALRAHDDRFNATVNKIELNKRRPAQIVVGRVEVSYDNDGAPYVVTQDTSTGETEQRVASQLALQFEELQSIIFARLVQKVGDRRYWEQWAQDVAQIAERQIERIAYLIAARPEQRSAFDKFLAGLQANINPSITEAQAVEMLAQHMITRPIFEALFEGYSFVQNNAVSIAMQGMVDALQGEALAEDSETLRRFYESVQKRAAGIDNAEGKQRIIIELYDKFFKTAFPKMVEQLGIVYTPVEVVDFILCSADFLLRQEFGRRLSDENVHILDPFTGTGTFMTRLLQSGLIDPGDLPRKYRQELHANEIVLLAYYIAAVNIENAYHERVGAGGGYEPFEGIVLTDTFQLGETDADKVLFSEMFPQNSERVTRQKNAPVRVIIGNPPYSVGQRSANDNAQNQSYPHLDNRIAATYVAATDATNKNSLYDSYIRAFRWSADRLRDSGGIIAFVSSGGWIDGNSADGFRKVLEREFTGIWVFNLRGNQRTSGELSRKEGGKIFGSGSRAPIAITFLVKNPAVPTEGAAIHYYDIGDYLSRQEKLAIIAQYASLANPAMQWVTVQPNDHGDWISQRNDVFETFIPLGDKDDKHNPKTVFVPFYGRGLATTRDAWCYNSSSERLEHNIESSIEFYNQQLNRFNQEKARNPRVNPREIVSFDALKFSWSDNPLNWLSANRVMAFDAKNICTGLYRPYFKQKVYFDRALNERVYQLPKLFPHSCVDNLVICVSGLGGNKENTTIITDCIPDLNCLDAGTQCFPLYYYEERPKQSPTLFDVPGESEYIRRDGVSDFILTRARAQYGQRVSKEDIFYYVYGFLHSPAYRAAFADDLKKMLPRLPLIEEPRAFWQFSRAGRQLAALHVSYESIPPCSDVQVSGAESGFFRVEKMRFPKRGQRDTILYNSQITVSNIPAQAYEYVVNGKSAIEWVMERYQVTVHKESGIRNDPNAWAEEVGNPRYILDLLLSVINVSVQTVQIVAALPKVEMGE